MGDGNGVTNLLHHIRILIRQTLLLGAFDIIQTQKNLKDLETLGQVRWWTNPTKQTITANDTNGLIFYTGTENERMVIDSQVM